MRRIVLLLASMTLAVLLFSGVALAAYVVVCPTGPGGLCEGTAEDDNMDGTPDSDKMYGMGGIDEINGLASGDELTGGDGDDTLNGDTP